MANVNKITFRGASGEQLAARLDLPSSPPRALALFAHCFTCGKDIAAASRISAGLVATGFGVLRFDFTGLGSSEGEFANANFSSNVADLISAAPQIPEVEAVVTIAAPSDPAHLQDRSDRTAGRALRGHERRRAWVTDRHCRQVSGPPHARGRHQRGDHREIGHSMTRANNAGSRRVPFP